MSLASSVIHASHGRVCCWEGGHIVINDGCVEFDWPGVTISLSFVGAERVKVKMAGGRNYFQVLVWVHGTSNPVQSSVFSSGTSLKWYWIAKGLDPGSEYRIAIIKRTEPSMRSALSSFEPAYISTFQAVPQKSQASNGSVSAKPSKVSDWFKKLRLKSKDEVSSSGGITPEKYPSCTFLECPAEFREGDFLELIGDSDVVAFGNEGGISGTGSVFSMDPSKQNIVNSFGFMISRMLGLRSSPRVTGASGIGITRNAMMCGSRTLGEMYGDPMMGKNIAGGKEQAASSINICNSSPVRCPLAVIVLAGGNDWNSPTDPPDRKKYVEEYSKLLVKVRRRYSGCVKGTEFPILCLQLSPSCASSVGSPSRLPYISTTAKTSEDEQVRLAYIQMKEWTLEGIDAYRKLNPWDTRVSFKALETTLDDPSDYGIMMHWSVNGHCKIAADVYEVLSDALQKCNTDRSLYSKSTLVTKCSPQVDGETLEVSSTEFHARLKLANSVVI